MKQIESVVIAVDGESKCGKTTVIEAIAEEAEFQHDIIPELLDGQLDDWDISQAQSDTRDRLEALHEGVAFNSIVTVSAGNAFRAATLYRALLGLEGVEKEEFTPDDAEVIIGLLREPGMKNVLQDDPNIGSQVSIVGQCVGVQALCGTLFADSVATAYHANGGGNLIVVDARDPIGHMMRNNTIGSNQGQVPAQNILPLYIDTSPEVAASRLSGDYEANVRMIEYRRELDRTRGELPVVRPANLVDGFGEWLDLSAQAHAAQEIAPPLCFDNGEGVDLDNVRYFAGILAAVAHDRAFYTHQSSQQTANALAY